MGAQCRCLKDWSFGTDGVVNLSGYVDTFIEKLSAERAARRVSGVEAIAEEIKINLPQHTSGTMLISPKLRKTLWNECTGTP